jgi:WS/DGAT/MGAT family acyltransferase
MARSIDALAHPSEPLLGSLDVARTGVQLVQDLAALALMPDDSPTRLKSGRPDGRKRVAWSEPLPLDAVKAVGRALGCSVNDVLLACAAGAIGRWLADQGDATEGAEIRAMVPVNLRPLEQAWQLGNRFGLAPVVLPVGIAHPLQRLFEVRQRMDALKHSYQPLLAFGVLAVTGLFVKPVQDAVLGLFAKKTTAVMTNVPGPREPLRFCGATLRQSLFWVPASGDVGVGVSILSYAGGVQFGLITDLARCDSPQEVVDRFATEFDTLLTLTLMLPWPAADAAQPARPGAATPTAAARRRATAA